MTTTSVRLSGLAAAGSLVVALLMTPASTYGVVLSQDTTGITHGGGESSIEDLIGFSTSGGPSGTADGSLSLQVDAPSGQVFEFDSSAYPGIDFQFWFRPIVGGDLSGVTATDPTFTLLNPTGSLAVSLLSASEATGPVTSNFNTEYSISGTGTFSGFRLDTTLTGTSGQAITWGGGDSYIRSDPSQFASDQGPVVALVTVPEPLPLVPAAAAAAGVWLAGRRRRLRAGL